MSDEIFYSGELATWKAWDDARKEWSTRLVTFEDYADGDPSTAIVTWGAGQEFRVHVDELSKPGPPPRPAWIPPPVQITAPEVPTGITVPDVEPLREDLRNAHASRKRLADAVDAAEALVAKAQEERDQAHKVLADLNIRQSTRVHELEDRLRNGTSANGALHDDIELPRSRAIEQAEALEQVLSRFQTELREARSRLGEHDGIIRAAAGKVALALFTARAAELCSIEQKAARLRAELKSADAYFTSDLRQQLSTSVATLLSMPPYSIEDPAGWTARQSLAEGRTKRWKELMTHLCEGDVEAELE